MKKKKEISNEILRLKNLNELDAVIEAINNQKRDAEMFKYTITSITINKRFLEQLRTLLERGFLYSINKPTEILGLPIIEKELDCDFVISNNKEDGWENIRFWYGGNSHIRIKELEKCLKDKENLK